MSAVVVENLSKIFADPKRGAVRAVDQVSFGAHAGRVFGILGANGAGKTTLLRTLATVLVPTEGSASIAGHDVVRDPVSVRRSIGFLSASTAVYGRLTVRETLSYFAELYGLNSTQRSERIAFVTDRFGLSPFIDTLGDRLSTGQRQRTSIARSVLHDPPVLFFDEPTAGLDIVAAQAVLEFVEESRAMGKAVLFSSHVMSEAERLCDDVMIVHQGQAMSISPLAELLGDPPARKLESVFLATVGYGAPKEPEWAG